MARMCERPSCTSIWRAPRCARGCVGSVAAPVATLLSKGFGIHATAKTKSKTSKKPLKKKTFNHRASGSAATVADTRRATRHVDHVTGHALTQTNDREIERYEISRCTLHRISISSVSSYLTPTLYGLSTTHFLKACKTCELNTTFYSVFSDRYSVPHF